MKRMTGKLEIFFLNLLARNIELSCILMRLSSLVPVKTFSLLEPVNCFCALGADYTSFSLTNFVLVFNCRIIVPLFKMLDMLFSNGCFELFTQDER